MTMLSVKSWNILNMMPQIKRDIDDSVLISFDVEMSGIAGAQVNACFETVEERYKKLKRVVQEHSPIQLGITFFRHDKKHFNKYIGSTYSFFLFDSLNKTLEGAEAKITFNYKSFNFLIGNMFNIKEWANDGLYFVKTTNKEKLVANFDQIIEQSCSDLNREVTNDAFYILSWLRQVRFERILYSQSDRLDAFEFERSSQLKLKYKPTSNDLFNYYFVLKVRQFLLDRTSIDEYLEKNEYLWCGNYHNEYFYVSFVKLVSANESAEISSSLPRHYVNKISDLSTFHQWMEEDRNSVIDKLLTIPEIIRWISQSNSLVVGHNCFLDLLFIYHNFIDQLPDTLEEFKAKIHEIFPKIFDTKLVAQQERILKLRYTSLLDCFVHLCLKRQAYRNCVPDVFIRCFNDIYDSEKDDYMNALDIKRFQKIEAHNAGFDSFITGFVFLYFGYVLMRQAKPLSQRKSDRKVLCDYRLFLDSSFKNHCNKLYLAKYCNQPLSLVSPTNPTTRFYSKAVLNFTDKLAVDIFQAFVQKNKNIDLYQSSPNEFYVGATHSNKMELFLYGLRTCLDHQKQKVNISKYEEHMKYKLLRKVSWIGFLSSAACFTFLILSRVGATF